MSFSSQLITPFIPREYCILTSINAFPEVVMLLFLWKPPLASRNLAPWRDKTWPWALLEAYLNCLGGKHTSSTVLFMIYRTIVTWELWPSRIALPMAWASINGFHCGSKRYMHPADVMFNLEFW